MTNFRLLATVALSLLIMTGCSSTKIDNSKGRATVYEDARSPGRVQGVGVESQDVMAMTDQMMRDMLGNPYLMNRDTPPRIIIDSQYFTNESSSRINKNMLTDRLRINLNRAANRSEERRVGKECRSRWSP